VGEESQASDEWDASLVAERFHDLGRTTNRKLVAKVVVARLLMARQDLGKLEEGTESRLLKRAMLVAESSGEDLDFILVSAIDPAGERLRHLLGAILGFHLALLPAHLGVRHLGFRHGQGSLGVEQSISVGGRSQSTSSWRILEISASSSLMRASLRLRAESTPGISSHR